ncbi:DUF4396 domain-containing protein [Micromonospora sicca]|uniref:DUF4396 domain-containing protein n=1 Tax=Micromonospora sicca TaxID=2202420 RepID=UPI0034CFA982
MWGWPAPSLSLLTNLFLDIVSRSRSWRLSGRRPPSTLAQQPSWPTESGVDPSLPGGWTGTATRPARHAPTIIQVYHCGTHCTLGVIIATPITYGVGLEIFGSTLWPEVVGDYVGAVAIGVAFRYSAEAHTGGRRAWAAMRKFFRSDLLTVSVFELGLLGWLALMHFLVFHEALRPGSPVFWLIIQVGLIIGFFAAWPPTSLLIRRGVKTELLGTPQ